MPGVRIVYLVEDRLSLAEEVRDQYYLEDTEIVHSSDIEKALKDTRVECVFICTPTFTHCDIVKLAFKHGKHVFCEKPISKDLSGTLECYDIAEKTGLTLFCSFNRRYDPAVSDVYNRVHRGDCGKIFSIKSTSRDNPIPTIEYIKTSGGMFHDCAVHDIDMISWILGEYPDSVNCIGHANLKEIEAIDDIDTSFITMKFPSNVIACIDLSRMAIYGYHQTLECLGDKGMVASDNQRPREVTISNTNGQTHIPYKYSFPERYKESYIAAVNSFFNILKGKEKLAITKQCVVNAHKIADACEKSLKLGQTVRVEY